MPGYVYLLHGSDHFSRDEQVRALKDKMRALPAGEHNLSDYRGQEFSQAEVLQACGAAPFLADRRMVIAEGLLARSSGSVAPRRRRKQTDTAEAAPLLDALGGLPESTALVLVENDVDRALLDDLRGRIPKERLVERSFGRREDLGSWVRQRVRAAGGSIENDAVRELLRLGGEDTALLANEIEKLLAYCNGQPIHRSDVEDIVVLSRDTSAFALLDSLADGDCGAALRVYRQLLQQGERPEGVLAQLAGFVRRLSIIRAALDDGVAPAQAAAAAQINPRTVDRLSNQARRFGPDALRRAYGLLLDADQQIKTGGRIPAVAVELVIVEFPAPERRAATAR